MSFLGKLSAEDMLLKKVVGKIQSVFEPKLVELRQELLSQIAGEMPEILTGNLSRYLEQPVNEQTAKRIWLAVVDSMANV